MNIGQIFQMVTDIIMLLVSEDATQMPILSVLPGALLGVNQCQLQWDQVDHMGLNNVLHYFSCLKATAAEDRPHGLHGYYYHHLQAAQDAQTGLLTVQ